MYTRKIYEPESKFSLQIASTPGASVRGGTGTVPKEKEPERRLLNDPYWMPVDTSAEEKIQRRRKNGSGQLLPASTYRLKEEVLVEDIPNLYHTNPTDIEHRVNRYVQEYASWYNSSLQGIDAITWNDRFMKNGSLDKGVTAFSARGDELRKYLISNREQLSPEYYNAVTTLLHDHESLSGDLMALDKTKRDVFSQFESQSSYDSFLAEWERQDQILKMAREDPDFDNLSKGAPSTTRFGEGGDADDAYYLINGGLEQDPFMNVSSKEFPEYGNLKEDEIRVFNYYYNTGNYQTAMEYLEMLKEPVAWRAANAEFQKYQGRTGKEILYGVTAGLDQFSSGVKGAKDAILGGENDYPATKEEYLSGLIRDDLEDNGPRLPWGKGRSSLGQVAYDVIGKVGYSIPSGVSSTIANVLVPGSGNVLEKTMTFGSAGGNAYITAKRMGSNRAQARTYAILEGTMDTVLGVVADKVKGLGKEHLQTVYEKVLPGAENAFVRFMRDYGAEIVVNGSEDRFQTNLESALKGIILDPEENVDWEAVAYRWYLDALPSVVDNFQEMLPQYEVSNNALTIDSNGKRTKDQRFTPQGVEYDISGLADKLHKRGATYGKSLIEAERVYVDAEKRFGSNAVTVLEYLQPGQDPRRFLDGFQNAYILGKQGAGPNALKNSTAAAYLTQEQREFAYALGARRSY